MVQSFFWNWPANSTPKAQSPPLTSTDRTVGYGPACQVVWEGRMNEVTHQTSPHPKQFRVPKMQVHVFTRRGRARHETVSGATADNSCPHRRARRGHLLRSSSGRPHHLELVRPEHVQRREGERRVPRARHVESSAAAGTSCSTRGSQSPTPRPSRSTAKCKNARTSDVAFVLFSSRAPR